MTEFPVHSPASAPQAARPLLEAANASFGMIPNLLGVFAESPALLEGYMKLGELFQTATAFDDTERHVLLLAVSAANGCDYCVAAHSAIATMQTVDREVVQGLRDGRPLADPKLEALRTLAATLVEKRGWLEAADVQAFLGAGYERRHLLDAILAVGMKTLSNFTNHVAHTPLDGAFGDFAWQRPS